MRHLLSIARCCWKLGITCMAASALIALVWLSALHSIQHERQVALIAFEARSQKALDQIIPVIHALLRDEIGLVMPSDAEAFVAARAKQALAALETFTNAQVWVYCSTCRHGAAASESAVRSPLHATTFEGISRYNDANGLLTLAAWSTFRLNAQTWQVGISLPNQVVLAQTNLHAQGTMAVALISTFLILALTAISLILGRRERRMLNILSTSQAQVREQRTMTEALSDINLALTSVLDLDEVMTRILNNVGRVVPYSSASVIVADDGAYRLAYWRFPEEKVSHVERYTLAPELRRVFDEMVRTRQPRWIADVETDPRWIHLERQAWVKSYIGMPIAVQDQVIGILNLNSEQRNHFTQQHVELLRVFAVQAGVALQNARLYAESRRYAAELERRVQERTLQLTQRSALFEAIVENMTDGLVYFDLRTQRTLYVNTAFLEMTGCTKDELLDQPLVTFKRFFRDPDFFEKARDRLREAGRARKPWRVEFEAVRKDGSVFDCALTATIVRNAQDEPIGQLNLVRDVTSERLLQEQRERFIANASHELRTPITNLKLRLYLARRDVNGRQKHFEVMEQMVNHLARLVENLLDLPRFEQGTPILQRETVNLCELVRSAFEMHVPRAAERQISFELLLPEQCVSLSADPVRLTQVVDNLIANALNYTPAGGNVRVRLYTCRQGDIELACLSVADTGIGIAPEALVHIFEPFFRARGVQNVRGTGLGLTIAKQIVELHGGTITVESQQGVGSTFTVHLPLNSLNESSRS